MVPGLRKTGVLWDPQTGPYQRDAFAAAARAAALEIAVIEYRSQGTIESVLDSGLTGDTQALVMLGSPLIYQAGERVAAALASRRLPGLSPFQTFPANGGLMSYGPDLPDLYRRMVPFLAKVLRGAKVGDMPIEQPSKFELVLNLKAAKALGLTVPPTFLLSANEVIE
jgi:putative ABC transport system substrate-binding protein